MEKNANQVITQHGATLEFVPNPKYGVNQRMVLLCRLRFDQQSNQPARRLQLWLGDQIGLVVHERRSVPNRPISKERGQNERDRKNIIAPRVQRLEAGRMRGQSGTRGSFIVCAFVQGPNYF